jgi:hypothetical protein
MDTDTLVDPLRNSESLASSVLQGLARVESQSRDSDDSVNGESIDSPQMLQDSQFPLFDSQAMYSVAASPTSEDGEMSEEGCVNNRNGERNIFRPELNPNEWERTINRLPSAVVRKLLLLSVKNSTDAAKVVQSKLYEELSIWRESRLNRLLKKLKRSILKDILESYAQRLTRLISSAPSSFEEHRLLVLDFCRNAEPYIFGAYEIACDFKKHYPLCIEVFQMVIDAALRLANENPSLDISSILSEWSPKSQYAPESFVHVRGFIPCVFRLWSHVLHITTLDKEMKCNPPKLHKIFSWSVSHDTNVQLPSHLSEIEGDSHQRNLALELYSFHFQLQRFTSSPESASPITGEREGS